MKEIILQGSDITDRDDFHQLIAQLMDFPDWYGNNLDALNDVLTDIGEDTTLIIEDSKELEETLEDYYPKLIHVLDWAQEENPFFNYELR